MCQSMVNIQSPAAEIRRGKKRRKEEGRRTNHSMKIYMVSLLHRATINKHKTEMLIRNGPVVKSVESVLVCVQRCNKSSVAFRLRCLQAYVNCGNVDYE